MTARRLSTRAEPRSTAALIAVVEPAQRLELRESETLQGPLQHFTVPTPFRARRACLGQFLRRYPTPALRHACKGSTTRGVRRRAPLAPKSSKSGVPLDESELGSSSLTGRSRVRVAHLHDTRMSVCRPQPDEHWAPVLSDRHRRGTWSWPCLRPQAPHPRGVPHVFDNPSRPLDYGAHSRQLRHRRTVEEIESMFASSSEVGSRSRCVSMRQRSLTDRPKSATLWRRSSETRSGWAAAGA